MANPIPDTGVATAPLRQPIYADEAAMKIADMSRAWVLWFEMKRRQLVKIDKAISALQSQISSGNMGAGSIYEVEEPELPYIIPGAVGPSGGGGGSDLNFIHIPDDATNFSVAGGGGTWLPAPPDGTIWAFDYFLSGNVMNVNFTLGGPIAGTVQLLYVKIPDGKVPTLPGGAFQKDLLIGQNTPTLLFYPGLITVEDGFPYLEISRLDASDFPVNANPFVGIYGSIIFPVA